MKTMTPARHPLSVAAILTCGMALLLASLNTAAAQESQYLFVELELPMVEQDQQHDAFLAAYQNGEYTVAHRHIKALLGAADTLAQTTARDHARLLSNAALSHGQMAVQLSNTDLAVIAADLLTRSSDLLTGIDPFHQDLVKVLMVTSLIQETQGDFETAIDSLRHAQHVVHRHKGVYAKDQLPIINRLAYANKQVGKFADADREYLFELRVSDRAYGVDALEKVPTLIEVGNHFALRAAGRPIAPPSAYADLAPEDIRQLRPVLFRTSFEMYADAIRILEHHYGPDDLRLIKPLKELAYARILQRSGQRSAEEAMERILDIVEANPGSDIPERVLARVELADIYTITSNSKASEEYLAAWQLLEENPDYADLQTRLFNSAERLYPLAPPATVLQRQPMSVAEGEELYVNLVYSIRDDGRTRDVRIVESNVPNDYRRDLQHWFRQSRYRPRIEEGMLVPTPDLTSHHVFRVLERGSPEPEIIVAVE